MQMIDQATLAAGRELDAMIARQVFGRTVYENPNYTVYAIDVTDDPSHAPAVPPYSTDIGAAWLVIEALRAQYAWRIWEEADTTISCKIGNHRGDAYTAALAIARAALKTVQAQEQASAEGVQDG